MFVGALYQIKALFYISAMLKFFLLQIDIEFCQVLSIYLLRGSHIFFSFI